MREKTVTAKKLAAALILPLSLLSSGAAGFSTVPPSSKSPSWFVGTANHRVANPQQSSGSTAWATAPLPNGRRHRRRSTAGGVLSLFRREISDLERWACQAAAAAMTIIPLAVTSASAATAASTSPGTAMGASSLIAAAASSTTLSSSSVFAPLDPLLEAEVLNDMAHVALDLFTVFGPARLITRLAAIVGRACAMLADYVPDHKMLPEELFFQSVMMLLACWGLLQALLPLLLAAVLLPPSSATLLRDGKAYAALFQPAGITWSQFKAMRALCVDWVEVTPHELVTSSREVNDDNENAHTDGNDDCIYWLHRGQANVLSGDGRKVLTRIAVGSGSSQTHTSCKPSSYKAAAGRRLLGETRLLTTKATGGTTEAASALVHPATQIQAGPEGATLLRIRARKLNFLLRADPSLAEAWRTLVVSSLHDKLLAQLEGSDGDDAPPAGVEPSVAAAP